MLCIDDVAIVYGNLTLFRRKDPISKRINTKFETEKCDFFLFYVGEEW